MWNKILGLRDEKLSGYIVILKKGGKKNPWNYQNVIVISHAMKFCLNFLQSTKPLQGHSKMNGQAVFRKDRTQDQIANIKWIREEGK